MSDSTASPARPINLDQLITELTEIRDAHPGDGIAVRLTLPDRSIPQVVGTSLAEYRDGGDVTRVVYITYRT